MKLFMRILIGIGTMIAGALGFVVLAKNETVQERLKAHYEDALAAGRHAAAAKRQALEADLATMMQAEKEAEANTEEEKTEN